MNININLGIIATTKQLKWLAFAVILLCYAPSAIAQKQQRDFAYMPQVGIQKRLANGWQIQGFLRGFLNQNLSEVGGIFGDIGVGYKITKRLKSEAHIRFGGVKSLQNFYEERYRGYLDIAYEMPIASRVSLGIRARYQRQTYIGIAGDLYRQPQHILRARCNLNYEFDYHWEAYASAESFHDLVDDAALLNIRTEQGINYKLNQHHSLALFYQQRLPTDKRKMQQFVLGTSYAYRW